ncbi:MAG: conjugal transfer protein TraN [Deltaproteobacteria bacterium]|nr:conjugal transfer protein TraN [Deltaproteobacteria bacterium]MDE0355865.1 conjugal transfer protein TraN [Deltaproteobacteria bacterium]
MSCSYGMKAVVATLLLAGHFAHDPAEAEDPKAAARALGQAGGAAASAIARDSGSAAHVPGYAGTNLPERGMSAGELETAANRVLADSADPGGQAGRAVIEGTAARPVAEVEADDPIVQRGDGIEGDAQSPRWSADGLASGSVTGCGAGVRDAGSGGPCGSVSWCMGAGCETAESSANTGFVESAARLNMVVELGGDEFNRGNLRFFNGKRRSCRIRWGGLANCCKNSGALLGLGNCTKEERLLARERHAGNTHYLGKRCTRRVLGVCVRRERSWCVFGSKLGRILQEAARSQLGLGWGSCRGFTVREMERIDFGAVDLSEFTQDLVDGSREPSIDLPEADQAGAVMRTRIRDFYQRKK